MKSRDFKNATSAWLHVLDTIFRHGAECSPRGMDTLEVLNNSVSMDMNYPIVHSSRRKLSFKFLAAEAHWILSGDNRVETIAPYNKNIAAFSDNGRTFAGAYGPRIEEQIAYVVSALKNDGDSRQAVLTIWTPNPKKSKDIPCTITLTFNIRAGVLNCHVFMRSSDAWLGFVYDVFNFSMIALKVAALINMSRRDTENDTEIQLGRLFWTAASSHLYEQHYDKAKACLTNAITIVNERPVPKKFLNSSNSLMRSLDDVREGVRGYPWKIP